MNFAGDMTVDMRGSDFELGDIRCYDSDGNELGVADDGANMLTLRDLPANTDYKCIAGDSDDVDSGNFELVIVCESDAPTRSPTPGPTTNPTPAPTPQPTDSPTKMPSTSPSTEPTPSPTANPSASPTTPSPTHPGELSCGSIKTGKYSGEPVEFEVRMPFAGDLTVDASASDFDVGAITCTDADGVEMTDVDAEAK